MEVCEIRTAGWIKTTTSATDNLDKVSVVAAKRLVVFRSSSTRMLTAHRRSEDVRGPTI